MMDLSPTQRLALITLVSGLPPTQFSSLVYALKPPSGVVPPPSAPAGDRAAALLDWVEGPTGQKMNELLELLSQVASLPVEIASSFPSPNPSPINAEVMATSQKKTIEVPLLNSVILEMVYIPPGTFFMGSPEDEEEREIHEGPQHKVKVPGFYMGKCPVTQEQWYVVSLMDDVDISLPPNPSSFNGAYRPVECVTWNQSIEFCKRLSNYTGECYRLPSESEWEYACRANTQTPYCFGHSLARADAARKDHYLNRMIKKIAAGKYEPSKKSGTVPVGQHTANGFGLHDMHGNVWEWCQDHWHDNYNGAPTDGSAWLKNTTQSNNRRIARGGSWHSSPDRCRSAYRRYPRPDTQNDTLGFRVALAP